MPMRERTQDKKPLRAQFTEAAKGVALSREQYYYAAAVLSGMIDPRNKPIADAEAASVELSTDDKATVDRIISGMEG